MPPQFRWHRPTADPILFGDVVDFDCPSLFGKRDFSGRVCEIDVTPKGQVHGVGDNRTPDAVVLMASEARKKKVELKSSQLSAEDQA